MSRVTYVGGRVLVDGAIVCELPVGIENGVIVAVGGSVAGATVDLAGRLLLPGIVDFHGDAFERQIMPRPGVRFPLDLALADTDRQLVANGITTAFHAVTLSWEPGLRGIDTFEGLLAALDAAGPTLSADTRLHLRWEPYALEAVDRVVDLIESGAVGLLAFNDHTPGMIAAIDDTAKTTKTADRCGLGLVAFRDLLLRIGARAGEVDAAVARVAAAGRAAGIAMASHDDEDLAMRARYRELGCAISEFPKTIEVARDAIGHGEAVVMGAPNVVRGGSHQKNATSAAKLVADRSCDVLASDYYYPAMARSAFRLAADGVADLADAWALISTGPADAARLRDRGRIAVGQRADLVIVDDQPPPGPRVAATLVAGRPVHSDGSIGPIPLT